MDEELFAICPYNKYHRVLRSRLQAHLVKCEKNGPNLAICPFNATHRMPEADLRAHTKVCPGRLLLEEERLPSLNHGMVDLPNPKECTYQPVTDPDEECWDDEPPGRKILHNDKSPVQAAIVPPKPMDPREYLDPNHEIWEWDD